MSGQDTTTQEIDSTLNDESKLKLGFKLLQILENWKLTDKDQLSLLGLSNVIKSRHLYLYRNGSKALDFSPEVLKRSEMILGIYESLSTTYPTNQEYCSVWLKRPVKKFNHKAPLELMLSGDVGMKRVWHFLDCTQAWRD